MHPRLQLGIVIAAVMIPALFLYALENPASTVAYVLFLEPSYVKKRAGYPMMDFRSYHTVNQTGVDLRFNGYEFETFNRNLSEGKSTPPYGLVTMEVKRYENLSQWGSLTLIFFNNRLWQVIFNPDNPLAYKKILQKKLNRNLKDRSRNKLYRYVALTIGEDLGGKTFFKWEDKRLMAEQQAWVMRHS